jgi:hypothetical protein
MKKFSTLLFIPVFGMVFSQTHRFIYELQDDKNNFVYSLIKSFNLPETFDTSDFLETHYGNNPIAVSLKQYQKIKLDHYNDPFVQVKEGLKDGGIITLYGEKITSIDQLDQKKKSVQEDTKKNYNPVELDKAIPYPN